MSGLVFEQRPGRGEQQGEFRCEALSLHKETVVNTIRLPRVEPELVNDAIVAAVNDAPDFPVRIAANSTLFAVSPFADRPWIASSRRERQATAAAALIACAATLGTVVGLFASLS
jgi:hypothetical protein